MSYERSPQQNGTNVVIMTACPACGEDILPEKAFPQHWRQVCPKNPANASEVDDD